MKILALFAILVWAVLPASAQRKAPNINTETPEGALLQKIGQENDEKAKLALMGIEATIQTVSVPDKGVFHRVRVGPFSDAEDMNTARTTLAQNGVQPSLVKVQTTPAKN